ncbi:DUF4817 domain-containing protein [Trichonephila clavipes]|uniref:DUF4817 domain-containing protein n=1 Tax=Trichonephila clavipes TaxID=2585209 RepID=A0A8X6V3R7_TRICX|nr:DUF4817 domain-containing protein [Trichonephila clavipes]
MTVSFKDHALLVKFFHKNNDCAPIALQKFRTLKIMKNGVGSLAAQGLEKMIQKFEETGSFHVQSGRRRKRFNSTVVEDVSKAVQEESSGVLQPCSARGIVQTLERPVSTAHKILRNTLHWYPYKISHVQELFLFDLPARETFVLEFLARLEVNYE